MIHRLLFKIFLPIISLLFVCFSVLAAEYNDSIIVKSNSERTAEILNILTQKTSDSVRVIQLNENQYSMIEASSAIKVFQLELYEVIFLIISIIIGIVGLFYLLLFIRKQKELNLKKIDTLSDRELAVIALVQKGKMNKEIADELNISLSTVKTHINNIYKKLKISDRKKLKNIVIKHLNEV